MARRSRTGDRVVDVWIEEHLQETAELLESAMKEEVGVDTGALQESIGIDKDGDDLLVGVTEGRLTGHPKNTRGRWYAEYHHDGTVNHGANPFLDKAMNRVK